MTNCHVNALDTILTETDIFPNTSSGIGPLSFFINLSRHVVINSIQINTSDYQNNTQIHVNKTTIELKLSSLYQVSEIAFLCTETKS